MLGKLTILSYNQFDERLLTFIKSHNSLNSDLDTKIRISRKSALRNIVNSYRKFILSFQKNRGFEGMDTIPEMPMNRKTLARLVGCCQKTAYNHIVFMIEAGVLLKKLHGRQNDFGVFLNPYFWLGEAVELPQIVMKKANQNPAFALPIVQNLPPISLQDFQEGDNYYKADVETVENVGWSTTQTTPPQFQPINEVNVFSRKGIEHTEKEPENGYIYAQLLQDGAVGGAAELSTHNAPNTPKTTDKSTNNKDKGNGTTVGGNGESVGNSNLAPQTQNQLEASALVDDFTRKALDRIYLSNKFNKNFFISNSQFVEIKQMVMNDVFQNFEGQTADIWKIRQKYTDAILAIDKAVDYGTKHQWTSFLHPKCYFSKKFQKSGKKGTFFEVFKWQENNKHHLDEIKKVEFLEKAKHHVLFSKSPRGRKDLTTQLQISEYFRRAIAKKCGAVYVSQFNQFLINPKNFNR